MPRFAANLTMLFSEYPFMERFAHAKQAGFKYVEYLFPYAFNAQELKQQLEENQLQQVLFNLPSGDWDAGERGIACLPNRIDEFRDGVSRAIEYAQILGVRQLNCLSGLKPSDLESELAMETFANNLRYAAGLLAGEHMTLLIEPINSKVDMPGFLLDTLEKADALLNELELPNLKLQFDIYHTQIMHGDIIRHLQAYRSHIGHIQFADNPGRHEPGTGELNFETIFRALDDLGYNGWISAEYRPSTSTLQSLSWLQTFN